MPTTLDLVRVKSPQEVRGIKQQPIEGFSFADSLNNANAPWHHTEQYCYIFGSRSTYKDGWKAELAYPNNVLLKFAESNPLLDESQWVLYNLNDDPTERIDLAKKDPEKLAELKAEFEAQAKADNLHPYITFDDMLSHRLHHTYLPEWLPDPARKADQSSDKQ